MSEGFWGREGFGLGREKKTGELTIIISDLINRTIIYIYIYIKINPNWL